MANEFKVKKGLIVEGSGGTILDIQGSVGQLFSITDSLTGDLFAVSDISGIPILNVNSSGAVDIDGDLSVTDDVTLSNLGAGYLKTNVNGVVSNTATIPWATVSSTPTTISGYGITDALAIGTTATTAMAGDTAIPSATDILTLLSTNNIVDWTTDQGSTNIHSGNYNNTQLSNAEVISAIVASSSIDNADKGTIRSNIGAGTSSFDGAYSSLSGTPTLGTAAAAATGDFATAAQGTTADAALPKSGGTMTGGITIGGSLSRGTYTTTSQYHTGADNIVLKGNSVGISSIFFESEKDGTNINHPSDFGFIQYHAYGTSTSGESNELIIGVSNDADDHLILNAPNVSGLKFRTGASATDYTIWHSGNDGASSGLDADLVDGIQASSFLRSDATDTFTGQLVGNRTDENIKVSGIRGQAKGSQTGEYMHLYERVHVGGPNGWGAATHGAPSYGLSTWGSVDFGMNGSGVIQLDGTTIVTSARALTNVTNTNWDTAYGWGDHGLSAQDKVDIGNLSGTNTGDQDLSSYITSQRAISSTPTDGATTTAISSDWAFDNVKTAVPANALFTDANTTYSAGAGLDLTGTTFSVETDLRDGITHVGKDTSNFIEFDSSEETITFIVGGNAVAVMESDGDLHIKGDVIAFSGIFNP